MTTHGVTGPRSLDDVAFALTDAERERLRNDVVRRASACRGADLDNDGVLAAAARGADALPPRLVETLRRFGDPNDPIGGMLIRNVPVDDVLCPTPADGYVGDWGQVPIATFTQLTLTSVLGDVIGYADEKRGNLIQDVAPVAGAGDRQENSGTVYLELHTEDGFHPCKPDIITLLCLRPDEAQAGMTVIGTVHDALPLVDPAHVATLREPVFRLGVASSFGEGAPSSTGPMAVLSGTPERPHLVADFHAMVPLSDVAGSALSELKNAIVKVLWGASLQAGDLLVVDNRVAVHGRTAFKARYDGRDRWLRRCFAVQDLGRSAPARRGGSRVVAPLADAVAALASGCTTDPVA